ncbi:spherulation-specific family 4 protein [Streptomyces sp. NPDC048566]|uniref:spherulation-specific family 4 protein n=1 Tax=Streptomyces sp. NPDC048566 TaxID=3365569 RepID=UPI003716A62A
MSLLIPLYVHPSEDPGAWHRLITAAGRTCGVVVNPADGPGAGPDPAFAAAAGALRAAGARLLGYVDTDYGTRDPGDVVEEVRRHHEWYGTQGCFLDRAASAPGALRGFRSLVRSVRGPGAEFVALNPGVHPAPGYARLADLLVTFEGHWSTYVGAFGRPGWTARFPPERFCHLVYGVPEALVPLAVRTARERGAAVACPVTGDLPNPWRLLTPALRMPQP